MFISDSFRQDILSKNTKIIPIVLIEKVTQKEIISPVYIPPVINPMGFSTNNLEISESSDNPSIYLRPILLGLPKLKESIDI